MITLKQDLKIYASLIVALLLFSCQSTGIDRVSSLREDSFLGFSEEILPEPKEIDTLNLTYSYPRGNIENYIPIYNPLVPDYTMPFVTEYSSSLIVEEFTETDLPELKFVKPEVSVVKPVVKPAVISVDKIEKIEKIEKVEPAPAKPDKTQVVAVKSTTSPEAAVNNKQIQIITVDNSANKNSVNNNSKNIIYLKEMDVITGKSFTVEMDQTGWLYEESIKNIHFQNKFYTSDKVLFEFYPEQSGNYTISFIKYTREGEKYTKVKINSLTDTPAVEKRDQVVIVPESIKSGITEKETLEKALFNIKNSKNPDEVYFKLAQIYYEEGLLRKSKEYYEYIYDNYPLSIYYDEAREKMEYIINNFLKVR